jgi:hypothetical protein
MARDLPSSSKSWQLIKVTSFFCMGLERAFELPPESIKTVSINVATAESISVHDVMNKRLINR